MTPTNITGSIRFTVGLTPTTLKKKTAFLHTLFVENERETSKPKRGVCFSMKWKATCKKLSSFGRGKKIRPKKSLSLFWQAPLPFNSQHNA